MSIKNLYNEEIKSEIEELSKMAVGTEEYKATVGGVTQLTDRIVKLEEIELEKQKLEVEREKASIEASRAEDDRKDKRDRNRISVANLTVTAAITVLGAVTMYAFEQTGRLITSQVGRKTIDRIFRIK